jgi:hypothetical protein
MQQHIEQVLTNPKASAATLSATVASGWANWFDVLNHNLTFFATLTGIILSWTMIVMHIRKMNRDAEEHQAKMVKIQKEIEQLSK